jgi:hypothetical protein
VELAKAQGEIAGQGMRADLLPANRRRLGRQGSNNTERLLS